MYFLKILFFWSSAFSVVLRPEYSGLCVSSFYITQRDTEAFTSFKLTQRSFMPVFKYLFNLQQSDIL
jgi:hypothetical protein